MTNSKVGMVNHLDNDSIHKSGNTTVYTSKPKVLKTTYKQLEVLLPLTDLFTKEINTFRQVSKLVAYVEFNHFVRFIVNHMRDDVIKESSSSLIITMDSVVEKEKQIETDISEHILYFKNDCFEKALIVNDVLTNVEKFIENFSKGSVLSADEIYNNLPVNLKNTLTRLLTYNKSAITDLWELFLINIGLLNIKSLISCAEYHEAKSNRNDRNIIPLKFVPKLGTPMSVLSKLEKTTINELQTKVVTNDFNMEYNTPFITASLTESEFMDIFNFNSGNDETDLFSISEQFGFDYDRYDQACQVIINSASGSVGSVDECSDYLSNFTDYIESIGSLQSMLYRFNKGNRAVLVDMTLEEYRT